MSPSRSPRRARVQLQILSRREVVAGLAAAGALGACDDGRFGAKAPTPDTGSAASELTPAITSNEDFYVTSCCGTPEIDGDSWRCLIRDGETELASFDLAWLEARTARDKEHTLECIGANPYNLAISNAVWTGLPLAEIFEALGVSVPSEAIEIVFTSEDGYSTSLPVADLDRPVWLVWRMNGVVLPVKHGFPARLLVPGRYGMKNPKWIVEIAFTTEPYTGFWEGYGWSQTAEYKTNALVASPERKATVEAGELRVQGMAFSGSDPIVQVQVCVDGGDWQDATLDYNPGADIWALWHLDIALEPGDHTIQARCVTASGAESLDDPEGSGGMNGYDGGMEVVVEAV